MKNKKILIPIIILIVFGIISISVPFAMYNAFTWKWTADFNGYSNQFNLVKDYISSEFPNESDKYLVVVTNKGEKTMLFDPNTKKYLSMPDEIGKALDLIDDEAFRHKDSNFYSIRIHNDRISFCISSGQYALVYSPSERPTWVNSHTEDNKARVRSIGDGWYHVVKK